MKDYRVWCREDQGDRITVYVAGKFRDDRMPSYIQSISKIPGVVVEYNWTLEKDKPPREAAIFDIKGVVGCDVFIAVMDDTTYDYRGTFTELGAAIATGTLVMVVGGETTYAQTNCFFHHPSIIRIKSFDVAIRALSGPNKFLILGAGRHGKDSLAEKFQEKMELTFSSSSLAANRKCVYPILSKKYGYNSEEECFEDRVNHRVEWYELICDYNKDDRARLAREIMSRDDIYVGMRDMEELHASRPLFDLVVWVDASIRVKEEDPSLHIKKEEADMIIDNNGTLEEFERVVSRLLRFLNK
jgi:hypothetical protein